MKKLASVFGLITLFISANCFSQDLIVKYDSTKLFCKITKEDSKHIYYIDKGNTEQSIEKDYVIKYYNHAIGIMQYGIAFNPNKLSKDSIGYKKDSLIFRGGHKFKLADVPLLCVCYFLRILVGTIAMSHRLTDAQEIRREANAMIESFDEKPMEPTVRGSTARKAAPARAGSAAGTDP